MTQATEAKGMLRTFWEGFKEGWNSNSAREETTPPTPEDVIEAADEWNVDDMPATAMTTAEAPQGKRSLVAFFEGFCEGFKEGWNNPSAYGNGNNKTVYNDDDNGLEPQTNCSLFPEVRVTYDPVYGSSDAMGMNHELGRAVYIYEDEY
jgi:hypothetical protein